MAILRFIFLKIKEKILYVRDYRKNIELHKCYGPLNDDKTFFVIRNYVKEAGWGSILLYVNLNIQYALKKGYYPIVDMKNYESIYMLPGEYKKVNVWEKYFEQVSPFDLDEVYNSKHVILCGSDLHNRGNISPQSEDWDEHIMISKEYIKLKPEIAHIISKEKKRVFGERNVSVLGVLARGTDYVSLRPMHHYIPYSAQEMVDKVKEVMEQYDRVYLATEDQNILDLFKACFDENVLYYTDQVRFNTNDVSDYLYKIADEKGVNRYEKGIEYLAILYTLAGCKSVMGSGCAGTYRAMLINGGKYESQVVLTNGKYS